MEDNLSVASSTSSSSRDRKVECPKCNKELTIKVMFNHIYVKHPGYFQEQTQKQWLLEAQSGKPLKICWNKLNDFDEEETVVLYGCMATKKTFMTEHKAMAHFTKCPDAFKDHSKEIKRLLNVRKEVLKINQKEKKNKFSDPEYDEYKKLRDSDSPDVIEQVIGYIEAQIKDCEVLYKDTKHLASYELTLMKTTGGELHSQFERIKTIWPTIKKTSFKTLAVIKNSLYNIIAGLEHLDGGSNLNSEARSYSTSYSKYF